MFDFRHVVLGFGLANTLCSTTIAEFSKGNLLIFLVTLFLAFPISLFIGKLVDIVDSKGEDSDKDIFDLLPEESSYIMRNLVVDSVILLSVTCTVIVLYTGSRSVHSDISMLAIIGIISIALAFLYQYIFYKLKIDRFTI